MSRFFQSVFVIVFLTLVASGAGATESQPNLLVVFTDDQRADAAGFASEGAYHSPALDRLAARSVNFTRAYAAFALCSPSRAALLSGQYGSKNGVNDLNQALLRPDRSIGVLLKNAGYQTAVCGKWHLKNTPAELGFDWSVVFFKNGTWFGRKVDRQGEIVHPPELIDTYCSGESVRFLRERDRAKPFFLWHCTQLPHMDGKLSWPASEKNLARFPAEKMPVPKTWQGSHEGKPEWLGKIRNRTKALEYGYDRRGRVQEHIRDYRATIADLDEALEPLWAELDQQELWKNTVVIFMGDNGWMLGEHGLTSKLLAYEASSRVPLLISAPRVEPGTSDALVSNLDIAPTLLRYAGVDPLKGHQGHALQPILRDNSATIRENFHYEAIGGYAGTPPTTAEIGKTSKTIHSWKTPECKEVVFTERYDLTVDPDEAQNLDLPVVAPRKGPPLQIGGIYPHLAYFNEENECGTGAVVPWADRLWVVTYAPHAPGGSSDKLHEITPDLELKIFPGSVGGTPANRMIHQETSQLLIGPHLIDREGAVRTIPQTMMYGRLTGNARHLQSPASKVYYATMEEGLYEVDVTTLEVKNMVRDGHGAAPKVGVVSQLPGYHGKGLYSGQGRVVYSNNGEKGNAAKTDPTTPSGALAEWSAEGEDWSLVRRNQFTEISGPGGIHGNANPDSDPIWAMGWDAKSVLLGLLQDKEWSYFRLPKGSHSYDGAHGWNTEWPRIREIGEGENFLATMHGTFWKFPASFSKNDTAGIRPRSNYLKVIGDFCRWNDRVVLGCDDSAKAEFLNTRPFKAHKASPLQSNSNLWFIKPERLDQLGPVIGRGSVWLREDVTKDQSSDPFLIAGYDFCELTVHTESKEPLTVEIEIDETGQGEWKTAATLQSDTAPHVVRHELSGNLGEWARITLRSSDAKGITAHFHLRNEDRRTEDDADLFAGVATPEKKAATRGLMRSLAHDRLGLIALDAEGASLGLYELGPDLIPRPSKDQKAVAQVQEAAQPTEAYQIDGSSILVIEDEKRYRLPLGRSLAAQVAVAKKSSPTLEKLLSKNLALSAKVTASGTHGSYSAEHAVDGKVNEDSRWIAGGAEKWITLDLGEEKTFQSIGIITGWNRDKTYAARNLRLEVKNEGQWKALEGGSVENNQNTDVIFRLPAPVSAQEIRLRSTDQGFLRIYEIGLFPDLIEVARPGEGLLTPRVCREVATERDLLNVGGTVFELPARNAFGVAKIRPVATHGLEVQDFCSHAGLLLFTGIDANTKSDRIFRSKDGQAAVWAGVIDELWQLGKPRGTGGPWSASSVKAGVPSDPYLMTGYDKKSVRLEADSSTTIHLEVDIDGTGLWVPYRSFKLEAGQAVEHDFSKAFGAYWGRVISSQDTTATVNFEYR